ncbi:beta strand repeat-containing protein [Flavobacterium sp.]
MKMKTTYFFTIVTLIGIVFSTNAQVNNTFFGNNAGGGNSGNFNSGFGENALSENTGNSNVAFGIQALSYCTGAFNCAFGNGALATNRAGTLNSAFGTRSLFNNTTGSRNIAIGHRVLEANVVGNDNTAIGYGTLLFNIGSSNLAVGSYSPRNLLTGDNNIFLGTESAIYLLHGSNNVFLGNRIAVEKDPTTELLAGNDLTKSIIIADGAGTQRIFVSKNGNTGLGLGNNVIPANKLDVKGGVVIGKTYTPDRASEGEIAPQNGLLVEGRVGIGTAAPAAKVEINSGNVGVSGLRFTNLNSNFNTTPVQPQNKFLTVNATGDVVLQKASNPIESNVLGSNANIMTSNVNGISSSANIVNSISNSINSNNQLVTTVNGVNSAPVTLPTANQTITQNGNTITLSNNGGSFVLPTFAPQTITQSGNTVTLSNGGGSFTLPTFTDTDGQSLSLTGNTLSISNGNSVTLPIQAPQTLSQTGNTVTLSNNGGSFTLPTFTDTDGQSLALNGNVLSISNGNSVTLPAQVPQTLSQTGNTITLSNGGGSFTMPTTTVVSGNANITVTGNGAPSTPYRVSSIDRSIYANNGTIDQATTVNGNRVVNMNNRNIWFSSSSSESNGKIYIGSTATYPNTTGNYKLFVEGGILTEKVKVALRSTANWADYVFEQDYNLMPLANVEEYIAKHKHLPGIDSAEELSKNGLDIAEMQAKHMAKIEELTLYIIEQNKTIIEQGKAIEKNSKDIEALKQKLNALTSNED